MKKGWEYKRLGDITEIKGGKRLPKGVKLLTTPTKHPYIRVADFNDFGTVDTDDIHYISDNVYEQIKRYIIKKEDVYISIAGTIGKSGIIPDYLDGANLTENACRLILSNNVYQRYIYYFTISPSFIKQIDERTKKSAQPKLALTRLSDVIISYPTIKEQQSIVDYLDSAFAKIDAMKANAEKALNEAKALFQASLKEMLEPKEGWEEKTLKEITTKISDGSHNPPAGVDFSEYEMLSSKNLRNDYFNFDNPRFLSKEDFEKEDKRTNLEKGDVLLTIVGAGLGECCVYNFEKKIVFQRSVSVIKPSYDIITNRFLMYTLQRNYNNIRNASNGAAQKGIYLKQLAAYTVLLPSLSEQHSIVTTLDSLKSKVDRLQEIYEKISQECDALKQAILRQVFE